MDKKEKNNPQQELPNQPAKEAGDQQPPKIDVVKGIEMLEAQLIESENKLQAAQKELETNQEVFQRTLAEYDNYRKRTSKEKAETYTNGMVNAVTKLLPMIDVLEMALAAPCKDEEYKKGIEMIMTTATNSLKGMGVEAIEALGQSFDPNFHAAVMQETVEGTQPGIVTKQLQKGYTMGEKVIRHATVAVSC